MHGICGNHRVPGAIIPTAEGCPSLLRVVVKRFWICWMAGVMILVWACTTPHLSAVVDKHNSDSQTTARVSMQWSWSAVNGLFCFSHTLELARLMCFPIKHVGFYTGPISRPCCSGKTKLCTTGHTHSSFLKMVERNRDKTQCLIPYSGGSSFCRRFMCALDPFKNIRNFFLLSCSSFVSAPLYLKFSDCVSTRAVIYLIDVCLNCQIHILR